MLLFALLYTIFINSIESVFMLSENFKVVLKGIFEMTMGIKALANSNLFIQNKNLALIILSFIVNFSGMCILFQIQSVTYKYKFKLKNLILNKFVCGIISCFITYLILSFR